MSWRSFGVASKNVVRVLEADPELGFQLDDAGRAAAAAAAVAGLLTVEPGIWEPPPLLDAEKGGFGLLLLEGCLARDVSLLDQRVSTELVADGDLLRPSDEDGVFAPVPIGAAWQALERTRLAVLDRDFAVRVGPWPEVCSALFSRCTRRAHRLATLLAISHVKRVDVRLLLLFWHYADQWGRVVRGRGVVVRLPLTHEVLGKLVGAQRPSVTSALKELANEGLIVQERRGEWVLRGDPPTQLRRLAPMQESG
jgi:CRP/FNR family cyclic AMP-dependent transcriptional regulator